MYEGGSKPYTCRRFEFRVFFLLDQLIYQEIKKPSLLFYLSVAGERMVGCIPFSKVISAMRNANSFVQDLKWLSSCPFPTTITITPLTHPTSD